MTSKEISKPLVSTIISTKNEGFNLTRLITSIKSQTYPNIEIVVVDNHSSDKTVNIARKFGARVYIRGPERSAQRNYGVIKSQGKYVLILDADMELTPNVIAQCVKLGESGLGGMIIPEKSVGEGFWAAVKSEERSWYLGDDSIEAERFFNKAILLAAGGYDESITGPEDWDLPLRTRKLAPHGRIKSFIIHHEGRQYFWKMVKKLRHVKELRLSLSLELFLNMICQRVFHY